MENNKVNRKALIELGFDELKNKIGDIYYERGDVNIYLDIENYYKKEIDYGDKSIYKFIFIGGYPPSQEEGDIILNEIKLKIREITINSVLS